jgi:Holliday junction resolvase RusA-like endonuclease
MTNEKADNNITVQVTYLESHLAYALQGKSQTESLFNRCNIHLHCKRKRLADPDGISCKSILDGLVKSGILTDDSAKFIEKISYSQEKSKTEETIITITEI